MDLKTMVMNPRPPSRPFQRQCCKKLNEVVQCRADLPTKERRFLAGRMQIHVQNASTSVEIDAALPPWRGCHPPMPSSLLPTDFSPVAVYNFPPWRRVTEYRRPMRIGAFHEALHIGVSAVLRKERGGDQHQNERRKEDADRGNERTPEARHEVAHEGGGDDHRSGADHADGDRDQKLPWIEPVSGLAHAGCAHEAEHTGERALAESLARELTKRTETWQEQDGNALNSDEARDLAEGNGTVGGRNRESV
jgi:hypothetical protein